MRCIERDKRLDLRKIDRAFAFSGQMSTRPKADLFLGFYRERGSGPILSRSMGR